MRSTLLIGCFLWVVICVHSLTRVERPSSVQKRAASPQVYQGRPNATYAGNNAWNQTQQFQWVKVNNQWVRRDGTKLPGYSQANVPYNQTVNQWNTPTPGGGRPVQNQPSDVNSWNNAQRPGNQSASGVGWGQQPVPQTPQQPSQQRPQQIPQGPSQQIPRRQNSTSQGGLGWNPDADRALTQDLPQTTPRPAYTTTPIPVLPQTPPPAYNPPAFTPPARGPFGSGLGVQQRPSPGRGAWNPDASLTYAGGGQNVPPQGTRTTPTNTNTGRSGTNPYGGIFNRLL